MSKYKQTTLFVQVLTDEAEHIYTDPANNYEKFIEMWRQRAKLEKPRCSKQDLVKQAQVYIN